MTILIPAYEPDDRLLTLVEQLNKSGFSRIVIVDDGSGDKYKDIFDVLKIKGCFVLSYEFNKGKGHALKTGFTYIHNRLNENEGIITADADGQHLVKDIIRVAEILPSVTDRIVLGERAFSGNVPFRSKLGNLISYTAFKLLSGQTVRDTQTGLRGFPSTMMPWLMSIKGERFEYESNMLLKAGSAGYGFIKINIETVYLDGNKSTHFRTIRDSALIFIPFLKFCLSGVLSAGIDFSLLFIFQSLTKDLLLSVIAARVASSAFNFAMNKLHVFKSAHENQRTKKELVKYYCLVCIMLFLNYSFLEILSQNMNVSLFWSKIITELLLFSISYTIQRYFIFNKKSISRKLA